MTIVGVPTVREEDGLAISSRNIRLNARERKLATALYHALSVAQDLIRRGVSDAGAIRRSAAATIGDDEALRLEYLEIVDHDMQPVDIVCGPVTIAGALWVGNTRLIDNIHTDPVRPS